MNALLHGIFQVQEANSRFCQAKAGNQNAVTREQKLKEVATAFDSYVELKSNLEEGTKVKLRAEIGGGCAWGPFLLCLHGNFQSGYLKLSGR